MNIKHPTRFRTLSLALLCLALLSVLGHFSPLYHSSLASFSLLVSSLPSFLVVAFPLISCPLLLSVYTLILSSLSLFRCSVSSVSLSLFFLFSPVSTSVSRLSPSRFLLSLLSPSPLSALCSFARSSPYLFAF